MDPRSCVIKRSCKIFSGQYKYQGWEYAGMDVDEEEEDLEADAAANEEEEEEQAEGEVSQPQVLTIHL